MRMMVYIGWLVILLLGCKAEQRPIKYGLDHCAFCHMSISDQRYGTELVTQKGKVYTFDSVECLIDFRKENKQEVAMELLTSIYQPGKLLNASDLLVVRCKAIPSPMGRYLTAVENMDQAKELVGTQQADVVPWSVARLEF